MGPRSLSPRVTAIVARATLDLLAAGPQELDDAIQGALATLGELDGSDRVYVTMYDGDGTFRNSHEWLRAGTPSHRDYVVDLATADFPWSVQLAKDGHTLNVASLDEIPEEGSNERHSFGMFGVQAVMQVPIHVDGTLRGLIGCNKLHEARRSDEEVVGAATAIAEAVAHAITWHEHERRLAEALATAEQAVRERDDMLARVSHELRTPLHAIIGFAELLRFEALSPTAGQAVTRIDEAGRQLLELVEHVIDLNAASPRTLRGGVPVRAITEHVVDQRRPLAASRGVRILLAPGGSHHVYADDAALEQLIDMLVAAAVSHSEPGGVVEVAIGEDGDQCALTVHDRGPAIDPTVVATMLELGVGEWVAEGRTAGVGLVRARALAESMGGALQLGNHPGGGVIAELRLELDPR